MAGAEEKASSKEIRADTRRLRILFAMSIVRTLCSLLSGIASAIVLWKVIEMAHR
jgi:hypothetical protein